ALANVTYENVKGLRWSSQSNDVVALDNWCFKNSERGLALENIDRALLRRNVLADNAVSQLLVIQSKYSAEDDCFERGAPAQLAADFTPFPPHATYPALADYQAAQHEDLHARESGCGVLPAIVDVRRLHAEATAYVERARHILRGETPPGPPPT